MAFDRERERRSSSGSTLITPFDSPTFEHDVSFNIREDVGAASISPSGRDVVLASKDGLYIIDLDKPYQPPHHVPNRSQWEVADVQWSPFASRDSWIVSTSNQKALVWNLQLPGTPIQNVLHAHDRAITDINFSAHDPDLLATCGVDSFVYCWDLRQPRSAALGFRGNNSTVAVFADWASGATQVKWNRQDPNIIASSHGKFLNIWDRRKGAIALKTIDAHATKVYGIDWNRFSPTEILTCGLDKTIKLWDYSMCGPAASPQAERIIRTTYPVWRARHTPFGHGVLAMPQRGSTELHLYDLELKKGDPIDSNLPPVHSFEGHSDNVKEFLWRSRGGIDEDDRRDYRDFQLVSWGRDQNLQLHKMEAHVLQKVGFERGQKSYDNIRLTRKDAVYRTYATEYIQKPIHRSTNSGEPPKSHLTALLAQSNIKAPSIQSPTAEPGVTTVPAPTTQPFVSTAWSLAKGPPGMHMKSNVKKAANVITWMQGVKMGKRTLAAPLKQQEAASKLLSPQSHRSHAWRGEVHEDLGDEITYVGTKFPKTFESLDVSRRLADIGVQGPWGPDDKSVFVRLSIRFPHAYPREATPEFRLVKTTSEITDLTVAKLTTEIQSIAEMYVTRKKGCIEAIVSYLLGERGLEESISWLSEDNDMKDDLPGDLDESSSDDEDAIGADFRAHDMDMSGGDLAAIKNANASVPTPRTCGARWTHDGRLVFFHLPRPEPKSLFPQGLLRSSDKPSRTPRLFDTFGRLTTGSPGPDRKDSSTEDAEDENGWETDSSSSTGDSSEHVGGLRNQFTALAPWKGAHLRFNATSQPSTESAAKVLPSKTNSLVSSYDFSAILPSKAALARGYEVYGVGPAVCDHNAKVADEHDKHDLADVWRLVGMILANSVPLEVMPQPHRKEPILVVARRAMVRIKRKDSGLDLAFDEADSVLRPVLKSRVKWGHHPLASSWLVPALFEHFEKLADTQMLAMLACVFAEPAAQDSVANARLRKSQHMLPLAMQAPAFSLDYFSSHEAAWSLYNPTRSIASTPGFGFRVREPSIPVVEDTYPKSVNFYGSQESSNGPWGSAGASEPPTPGGLYSTGNTPPVLSRASTFRSSTANTPYSTSPEQTFPRRSTSNLANAFAKMTGGLVGSSPPTHLRVRNSNSEADLSTSAPTNSVTWGTNTFYSTTSGSSSNNQRSWHHRKRASQAGWLYDGTVTERDESDGDDDLPLSDDNPSTPVALNTQNHSAIKVTLRNQDQFDEEGCVSSSLLAHIEAWKLAHYRQQYADQLLLWGLAVQRAEILKYNGLISYWEPNEHIDPLTLQIDFGKRNFALVEEPDAISALPSLTDIARDRDTGVQNATTNPVSERLNAFSSPKKFRFNPEASPFTPTSFDPRSQTSHPLSPSTGYASLDSSLTVTLTPPTAVKVATPYTEKGSFDFDASSEQTPFPHCSMCLSRVGKLYSICETCRHIAHVECVQLVMDGEERDSMCVMGCGCWACL